MDRSSLSLVPRESTFCIYASFLQTPDRTHSIRLALHSVLNSMRYLVIISGVNTTPIGPLTYTAQHKIINHKSLIANPIPPLVNPYFYILLS